MSQYQTVAAGVKVRRLRVSSSKEKIPSYSIQYQTGGSSRRNDKSNDRDHSKSPSRSLTNIQSEGQKRVKNFGNDVRDEYYATLPRQGLSSLLSGDIQRPSTVIDNQQFQSHIIQNQNTQIQQPLQSGNPTAKSSLNKLLNIDDEPDVIQFTLKDSSKKSENVVTSKRKDVQDNYSPSLKQKVGSSKVQQSPLKQTQKAGVKSKEARSKSGLGAQNQQTQSPQRAQLKKGSLNDLNYLKELEKQLQKDYDTPIPFLNDYLKNVNQVTQGPAVTPERIKKSQAANKSPNVQRVTSGGSPFRKDAIQRGSQSPIRNSQTSQSNEYYLTGNDSFQKDKEKQLLNADMSISGVK